MVSTLDSGASARGLSPGQGHCVVFLARGIQSIESIIDDNQYQSIPIDINRLILIINDQSRAKIRVVIDWYRLSISIDR